MLSTEAARTSEEGERAKTARTFADESSDVQRRERLNRVLIERQEEATP